MKTIKDIQEENIIYKIENKNGIYIGRTNNFSRRLWEHFNNGLITNFFGKEMKILEKSNKNDIIEKEKEYIKKYKQFEIEGKIKKLLNNILY